MMAIGWFIFSSIYWATIPLTLELGTPHNLGKIIFAIQFIFANIFWLFAIIKGVRGINQKESVGKNIVAIILAIIIPLLLILILSLDPHFVS